MTFIENLQRLYPDGKLTRHCPFTGTTVHISEVARAHAVRDIEIDVVGVGYATRYEFADGSGIVIMRGTWYAE